MELNAILGQAFGVLAVILGFVTFQMRTSRQLLIVQIATTLTFVVHYLLLGAVSGMAMNVISTIRNVAYYKRDPQTRWGKCCPFVFAAIMGAVGVMTWQDYYSVFVVLGLVVNTLGMSFVNPQNIRRSILVSSPLVLVYNLFVFSVGGTVYESVAIASALIGMFRFRGGKSPAEGAEK